MKEVMFVNNQLWINEELYKDKGIVVSYPEFEKITQQFIDEKDKYIKDNGLYKESVNEQNLSKLQIAYREFFQAKLVDFGIKSPVELKTEEDKKKFWSSLKKEWATAKKKIQEGRIRQIIRGMIAESLSEYDASVSQKYLGDVKKYKPLAKKKLEKMGFKVKDKKNEFELSGGDVSKLHTNYISTHSVSGKILVGASEFESIAKIKEAVDDPNVAVDPIERGIVKTKTHHKRIGEADQIAGGKGDKTKPEDVDQQELGVGIAVEKEHTDDESVAREIALDHLAENPKYYTELVKSGIVDEPDAIKLAKKYGLIETVYRGYEIKKQNKKNAHPYYVLALKITGASMKDMKDQIDKALKNKKDLSEASYGTHLMKNPNGSWSFVGTIPIELGYVEKDGSPLKPETAKMLHGASNPGMIAKTRVFNNKEEVLRAAKKLWRYRKKDRFH